MSEKISCGKRLFHQIFAVAFVFGISIQSFFDGVGFLLYRLAGFACGGFCLFDRAVEFPVDLLFVVLVIHESCGGNGDDQKQQDQGANEFAFAGTVFFVNDSGGSFM